MIWDIQVSGLSQLVKVLLEGGELPPKPVYVHFWIHPSSDNIKMLIHSQKIWDGGKSDVSCSTG
jgi:hypothetical protein